jgi:agmatinase
MSAIETFDPNGVGQDNGNFFSLPFSTEEARLILISAMWDVTASYGAGTAQAPKALIKASTQLDLYDELSPNAWQAGIATVACDESMLSRSQNLRSDATYIMHYLEKGGDSTDAKIAQRLQRVNEGCSWMNNRIQCQATSWLAQGKIVGLVGGDHSTPLGLVQALATQHSSFGILHLDAHCDLRQAYEGFEFSHASIMYNILHRIPAVERIVQVGVRDYCDAEATLARESQRIRLFSDVELFTALFEGCTWAEQCRTIVAELPHEVYISFDIDALSVEYCPHTGTPVAGGLSFNQALYLLHEVVRSGRRIIGFDVVETVVCNDESIDASTAARILYRLCGMTLVSNS